MRIFHHPAVQRFSGAMTVEPQATLLQNSQGEAGPGGVGYATDAEPMEAILAFFLMALSHREGTTKVKTTKEYVDLMDIT